MRAGAPANGPSTRAYQRRPYARRLPLRVLHTPTNTGNHPQGIARAERELGLDSRCVELWGAWLEYDVDEVLARPGDSRLAVEGRRWGLLRRAWREFDVVHFNFGSSILPAAAPPAPAQPSPLQRAVTTAGVVYARLFGLRDLPLLRRAGKTIVVTFQGDDARQGTGAHVPEFHRALAAAAGPGYYTAAHDERKRRAIAAFERYADRIYYLNPDLGAFLPPRAEFLPYGHVDPRRWPVAPRRPANQPPVIVHAPSHRGIKGTSHVIEAVERLRAGGVEVDLRVVHGVPHGAARAAFENADILVDQVLVGWYGGVAVELMALGKPVVCFIADEWANRYAPTELVRELPVVRASAAELADVLNSLLAQPDRREELGQRGRGFVERWHDPLRIAGRLRHAYEGARR